MTDSFEEGRRARRGLAVAGVVTAAFAGVGGAAIAGECPRGQEGIDLISSGPTAPVGVSDNVIGTIDVAEQVPEIPGHLLRTRMLTIQPGGVVPFHSHETRPALIYILSGEITEFSSTCIVPILHKAGEISQETAGVAHWWQNTGTAPATLLSSDIVPNPDTDAMM